MEIRKKTILLVGIISLLWTGASIGAQETEDEMPEFVRETIELLRQDGWSEEQLEDFRAAAEEREWEDAEDAEPEVVAMALQLANQDREELEGAENAELALELAAMARNMERSGFGKNEISRAAFEGTRAAVQDMERIRAEEGAVEGEAVREEVQERVQQEIHKRMNDAMDRQSRARGRAGGPKGAGKDRGDKERDGSSPGEIPNTPGPNR
ncbi:MAG: hypothetical protein ACLFSA_11220 [Spirochaetaceae bacterium]